MIVTRPRATKLSQITIDTDLVLGAYKLKFADLLIKQSNADDIHIRDIGDEFYKSIKVQFCIAAGAYYGDNIIEKTLEAGVQVDGALHKDSYHILPEHTPTGVGDTGVKGQICFDANYTYVCYATDTWARIAHAW